jgi:hypothetical protein
MGKIVKARTAQGARHEFQPGNSFARKTHCKYGHLLEETRQFVNGAFQCGVCRDAYQRKYRLEKGYDRKRHYGIGPVEYAEMLVAQGGVCAICKGVNPNGRELSLDHDHHTMKARGILCNRCNLALGKVKDDTELLWSMIQYLEGAKSNG